MDDVASCSSKPMASSTGSSRVIQPYERLEGILVTEVRPASVKKSSAVPWLRDIAGHAARLIAFGDDVTDEHMFQALSPQDDAVVVRTAETPPHVRALGARTGPDEVRSVLRYILAFARGKRPFPLCFRARSRRRAAPPSASIATSWSSPIDSRISVISKATKASNGRRTSAVSISALEPALARARRHVAGLGRSNRAGHGDGGERRQRRSSTAQLAWFDYKESWYRDYYSGFCNGTLWPLFHSFPSRVTLSDKGWEAYREVHEVIAEVALGTHRHARHDLGARLPPAHAR